MSSINPNSLLHHLATEDGQSRIHLRDEGDTVWLTQLEMAELFLATKKNMAKHLEASFAEVELDQDSALNHWLTTTAGRQVYRGAVKESLTAQLQGHAKQRVIPQPNKGT